LWRDLFLVGKVDFGWRIPSFPVDGSRKFAFVSQILDFIGVVEDAFDSMWISDHFVPWATFQSVETDILEAWTTLSYLSGVFSKPKFGNIVLCNSYRNPALLAKMGATLDALTGGRFIMGIGAGWKEDEYIAYGYEFPSASVRIGQLEEGVQIIRLLWREDNVTFHGKYYRIRDAYCDPKPDPVPPIMIGGGGEKLLLRVVAKYADWWNLPNATVSEYGHKLDVLEKHCKAVGRDFSEIKKTLGGFVAIAEKESEAKKIASASPFLKSQSWDAHFIGTPERVIERLGEYVNLGVELFILRFLDFPSTKGADLFIEKVVDEFK